MKQPVDAHWGEQGIRIGVDEAYCTAGVAPQVSTAVLAAISVLRDLGASIHEVKVSGVEEATDIWFTICSAETAAAHEQFYPSRADEYGPTLRAFLAEGAKVCGLDYAKAHVARQRVCRMVDNLLHEVDLLLCPSLPAVPMLLKDFSPQGIFSREGTAALLRHTAPFDLTGSPTISVPCGFSSEGLPLSLQLIGRHDEEGTLMQAGHAYEQATEWHTRRPPV